MATHSLVAATSDTIRIWDLGVSSTKQKTSSAYQRGHRSSQSSGSSSNGLGSGAEHAHIATDAVHTADKPAGAIDSITAVSWASDGNTFVVGGRGTSMRQYGRTGETLQDIKLNRQTERGGSMSIAAVKHYGSASESLFVGNSTVRQVRRWDFVRKEYTTCQTHESDISCLAVCAKKRIVASATAQGGEIALFNLQYNTRSDLRSATHKALTCIDIAPGLRSHVSVGSEDGLLQLFDATRSGGAPLRSFSHLHSAPLRGLEFHALSSSTLVTVGLDKRVVVTDANAYSASSNTGSALEIRTQAPLTCLACAQDPYTIGVGTIDGDVLVYDARMTPTPLWSATVRPNHAVVAMDIAMARTDGSASSQPLARSTSQRESRTSGRPGGRSIGYSSSDDGAITGVQPDRRRVRGLATSIDRPRPHDDKPTSESLLVSGKRADTSRRPPQHPSISRFRAAITEHRRHSAAAPLPKPVEPPFVRHSVQSYKESDDAEDMAMLAKDRSYMDLLSPAKPDRALPTANSLVSAPKQPDMLSLLSNRKQLPTHKDASPTWPEQQQPVRNSQSAQEYKPNAALSTHTYLEPKGTIYLESDRHKTASKATDLLNTDQSPLSRPLNSHSRRHEQPQSFDAGDSIMEMFTPEREPRNRAPAHTAISDEQALSCGSPKRIAKSLVSQLLERQSASQTSTDSAPEDLPASVEPEPWTSHVASNMRTLERESVNMAVLPDSASIAVRKEPPSARPNIKPFDRANTKLPATTTPVLDQPAASETRPVEGFAAAGLGSVSNSVLQNAVADALAPLCEQIRGEIRNLHLDIIRQGFVYQEQIRTLRHECSEARALRQEMDQLRRENEQLRRYVPFFEPPSRVSDREPRDA
ncbi:hypothetical protein IW141_002137 [Coemansia sp. RSA 355]|nr:hypothetical protein IW141_002137 [Coemansia sp. RSA 355]